MELPLIKLKNGESGSITSIKGHHHSHHHTHRGRRTRGRGWGLERRLADMGLTPGTRVTVVKSAPLRGPLEVVVRGSRLALGRGMAERILVEVKR